MKKNYFVVQLVLLVLIGMLAGCKKDSIAANEGTQVSEKGIANLKSWYEGGNAEGMATVNQNIRNIGTLNWDATMYNRSSNSYITPIINLAQKTGFTFLVAYADNNGSIQSGKYVFIFVNSAETKLLLSSKINPNFVEGSLVPNDFSGAIIDQNLQNKYIASKHFENGKINDTKKDDVVYKAKRKIHEELKNNGEPDPNVVPDPSCIDWYWQTWIDGVLVSEVYQFTTCNAGGGAGGGTSNGGVNCSAYTASLSNITVTHSPNYFTMGNSVTLLNGKLRMPVTAKGTYNTYHFPGGYDPSFNSHFNAVLYKNNSSDPDWKWESFVFADFSRDGGTMPPNVTADCSGNATTVVSTDKIIATSSGNFTVIFKLQCGPLVFEIANKNGAISDRWNSTYGTAYQN